LSIKSLPEFFAEKNPNATTIRGPHVHAQILTTSASDEFVKEITPMAMPTLDPNAVAAATMRAAAPHAF
jgi:hypothetical protein